MKNPLLILGMALVAGMAQGEAPADRVLTGGRVLTVDAEDRVAQAIAIRGGRIVAVGTDAEIAGFIGPATERIELAGRTATPGLIDAHVHFSQAGLYRLTHIDLAFPQVRRIADAARLVEERAAMASPGEWILGRGWDEGKLDEQRYLRAADLDAAGGGHPVWLMHTTGHYGVANSAALSRAGITRATPDPPGGVIDRDAAGEPTGVLKETAVALVTQHIPPPDRQRLREGIRAMAQEFNRECMTGAKEPGLGGGFGYDFEDALDNWNAYREVLDGGGLTVRILALWRSPYSLEEARDLAARIAPFGRPQDSTADRLVSGGVKIFADGSGGARTAWVSQDWNRDRSSVDAGNRGYPTVDEELLRSLILLYHEAGLHVGVHAIGDRAIDWVVDSFALALEKKPTHGLRHSIIHANLPTDRAMDAMAAMQQRFDAGYPEPSANFTWWIGDTYAGNFGAARSLRLNPFASFTKRGIHWAGGSDYSVTPFPARYGIWASMAREPLLGVYGGDPFGRAEAADVRSALRSYTIWAAHQLFMDERTGSLETGKRADIAVWDTDFYTAAPAAIKDARCEMTLFDGAVVWRREP